MVQYYTLEQAAKILQTTPEKVKEMAKKNEVRAFQDRGSLRFRAPEIDELARSRGLGSDPALTLGEAPPKSTPPSSATRRKSKLPLEEAPIAFAEDDTDEAPIGKEPAAAFGKSGPPSSKNKPASPPPKVSRRPTMTQPSGMKSPPPRGASDSDVRLVPEGSGLDFQVVPEAPKSSGAGSTPSNKSGATRSSRPSKLGKSPDPADSGVRIVPMEDASDSDVKITPDSGRGESALSGRMSSAKKPSDSDIRLEDSVKPAKKSSPEHPITEEIDLDEEERRANPAARTKGGEGKVRPKVNPLNLPTSSPFELSEADMDVDKPASPKKRPSKIAKPEKEDSSSDFELKPIGNEDSSPLELSSGEVAALQADDSDEVSLGELTGQGAARSGINLQDPADSGISLEQGGSDEMELSLDSGATPKPGQISKEDSSNEFELAPDNAESAVTEEESSSEFELALTGDDGETGEEESSSEFELSLDADGSGEGEAEADSDSEFELTLDPESGLESSAETDALTADGEEKDIFETDFEVPALEEDESGSQAVDDDTDLETSDFDLDVAEGSSEEDAESGSQVVSLGEEDDEIDEGAKTEARPRRTGRRKAALDDDEGDLDLEIDPNAEPEDEEEEVAVGAASAAPPAPWGPLPAVLLIPSVLILFVVALLTFELAGTMWNYRQPGHTTGFGIVLHPIAKYFDSTLPD
jgi:hypothetical protein